MLYPDEENDAEGVGDEYGGYEDEYGEGSDYYSYEEGPKVDSLEGEPPFQSKSLPGVTGHDLTDIKAILNEFAILNVSPKVRTYEETPLGSLSLVGCTKSLGSSHGYSSCSVK